MFKVTLLIALAIAGAHAQQLLPGLEPAPEPYSYGYETDTHNAAEQRDPSGRVTGYYTLAGPDGRERRVEYFADEAGFHAKVLTNEVGTKSDNSADVEVQAAPPTAEQLAQGTIGVANGYNGLAGVASVTARPVIAQTARVTSAPLVAGSSVLRNGYSSINNFAYGYPGYGYANGFANGYGNGIYGNGLAYGAGLGYGAYGNGVYGGYGNGVFSSYNNHLPSQYYRSIGVNGVNGVNGLGAYNGLGGRYVTAAPALANGGYLRSGNFQTIGYNGAIPAARVNGNLLGSSNYVVLKKREVEANKKA